MNCLIGLSLTLVALVAGMLLLAQTQKDNLGNIYKAVSYFVIITSVLAFLAGVGCGICQLAHCGKGGCGSMEKCQSGAGCMPGGCCMGGQEGCGKMMRHGMGGGMGMGCGMGMKKHKMMCGKGEMMHWEEGDEEMEDVNVEIIHKKVEKEEKEEKKEEPAKK